LCDGTAVTGKNSEIGILFDSDSHYFYHALYSFSKMKISWREISAKNVFFGNERLVAGTVLKSLGKFGKLVGGAEIELNINYIHSSAIRTPGMMAP
jgi:hypothetical protein